MPKLAFSAQNLHGLPSEVCAAQDLALLWPEHAPDGGGGGEGFGGKRCGPVQILPPCALDNADDSIPHSSVPRLILKYPCSPHHLFQEFATFQYLPFR